MTTYYCQYCSKKYIRKNAFNNHLLSCRFHKICKLSENSGENINIESMNININNVYKLLIDLHNKYDKLEADYNELKKYVVIIKNKINIIDYLNQNISCIEFDYIDFINSIVIGFEELDILFKKDYVDGIFQMIINTIERLRLNDTNIPIKAFNHKDGILYIYLKSTRQWNIIDEQNINYLIKNFDKKILTLFLDWKVKNENSMDEEQFSQIYILNMKKVVGGNYDGKNKKILIKNKLYKYLRVNLKNVVSYEFD